MEDILHTPLMELIGHLKYVGLITWAGGAYGNGKYVVIGNNGYIAYSTDDINWIMKG